MKKLVALVMFVVSLIALARMLTDQPLPTVADFLAMTQTVDVFRPDDVFRECAQIIENMMVYNGDHLASIWEGVDITNFFEKLGLSFGYIIYGIGNFIGGVFLSSLNLLKIPLQALLFLITIIYWVFGVTY